MKKLSIVLLLLAGASSAYATTVTVSVSNLFGNTWQSNYTITSDTLDVDIEEFTIYFDYEQYANLQTETDEPAGWDSLVIQPDVNLTDDGFYDSLALGAGIAPGQTLGGFSVVFDFLGSGTPGAQPWEIVDPDTFAVIDSGMAVVPVPAAFWLLLSGLVTLKATRNRGRP